MKGVSFFYSPESLVPFPVLALYLFSGLSVQ